MVFGPLFHPLRFLRKLALLGFLLLVAVWAWPHGGSGLIRSGASLARQASSSGNVSSQLASNSYTVRGGDTLWGIASRLYPHADTRQMIWEIAKRNHLGSDLLVPGQKLQLP